MHDNDELLAILNDPTRSLKEILIPRIAAGLQRAMDEAAAAWEDEIINGTGEPRSADGGSLDEREHRPR